MYLRISVSQRIEPTACRIFHSQLHHFFKPSTSCRFKTPEWDMQYKINSWGLRDKEYEIDKPVNTYRILVTGDSFTEGFGVKDEHIFVNLLEDYLNRTFDHNFEVINAGVSSWSATPEYLYLKNYGVKYSPNLVVVVTTISDFSDEFFYERAMTKDSVGERISFQPEIVATPSSVIREANESLWERFKRPLRENLKMYRFLSLNIRTLLGLYNPAAGIHPADIANVEADQMAVSRLEDVKGYSLALTKLEQRLKQIANFSAVNNTEFLLVLLPHPHMVNGREWAQGRKYFSFKPGVVYSRRGFDDLTEWAHGENIAIFDLIPPLQIAAIADRLYFNQDGHLNPRGHAVVGKALHAYLAARFSGIYKTKND